jgi:methionine-rich copper-binding protein CopC
MKRHLIVAAFALYAPAAFAHAQLESASPPVGGTVDSPSEVRITFSEGVEPKFTGLTITGPGGSAPVGKASVAPGDNKVLIVKVGRKLAPGTYTVKWHAVSVDTHHTQGDFDFTVK